MSEGFDFFSYFLLFFKHDWEPDTGLWVDEVNDVCLWRG